MTDFRTFIPIFEIKKKFPDFEEYGYSGKKLAQMIVYRKLRNATELAELLFEYRKSIGRKDYQVKKEGEKDKIGNIRRAIDEHLKKDSIGISFISEYCAVLKCSADYFVGIIDEPTHSDTDIHEKTGLSIDAIAALELIKSDVDNIDVFYNNELETLNFILEDINKKQKKQNNGIGYTKSILHYIGLYIDSEKIKKESATKIRYKCSDKPSAALKIGDNINGHAIQGFSVLCDNTNIDVNDPEKLSVYDIETNQHYPLTISGLFKAYSLNKVQEKLFELSQERKNSCNSKSERK